MDNHLPIILAINAGTREIGIAVLEGKELLFYTVKTIKERKIVRELLDRIATIIGRLISEYHPTHLAIKKVKVIQKGAALAVVVTEHIKAIAREARLKVCEYDTRTARQFICQSGRATRQQNAKFIAARYCPELSQYADCQKPEYILYWSRLFDVIAAGLYSQDLIIKTWRR